MKKMAMCKILNKTIMIVMALSLMVASCNDEEDPGMEMEVPTGMITVSDQVISQNTIVISNLNLDADGWVVVHASTSDGTPVVPDIISAPVMVEAGSQNEVEVKLTDVSGLSDGDQVWVMLHTDDGVMGEYEFDGNSGLDAPITDVNGEIVMTAIELSAPSVTVGNQVVNENMVTIPEVNAAVDGWLVIHADNGSGAPGAVLGQTWVAAGMNSDVMVDLGTATFAGGELLFPMLHIEDGGNQIYEFPDDGDAPEVFGESVIVASFETEAPSGSISVMDQIVQGNMLTVSEITLNATGWVVVHASNATNDGPEVPGIISTPVQLDAGTSTDVSIMLNETFAFNADDQLYVMLHTDNGVIGEYEFDGTSGFDGPITTESLTLGAPSGSFIANNQIVSQNTIMVESITVDQPSWVVIHRDNGQGSFEAPGIISVPVELEEGTTENVEIRLADSEGLSDGETLWVMLHNDNGVVGTYEFDGANGLDLPISFSSIEVEAPAVSASDQIVTDNMVSIDEVKAAVDGWLVIHADDGSGAPGAVIGQVYVEAGSSSDVLVDLGDYNLSSGDMLFPMLHVDSPADMEYTFPDNGDGPEVFNENVIVVSMTAL